MIFFVTQSFWVSAPYRATASVCGVLCTYQSVFMQQRVLYPMGTDVSEESAASVFSANVCTGAASPDDRNLDPQLRHHTMQFRFPVADFV